ncbi:ABC transporter ATP-binding protein [Desulfohalovibrio reitneri]|uniref:ABC transporter ATP-binding protein n=1 Tax=Desulfohalovibrio reitneri TaxID=1307759 RepID=UPI0004A77369|nr:ABC transporter ATP-binding protein [Desulfohalovibrio reitneri]
MLRADRLAKLFGPRLVFKDVSFEVLPGETWLVAGDNGAGKSTLLAVLAGLLSPSAGKIESGLKPGEIGYLGHETFQYPRLSAVENLRFWAKLHGRDASEKRLLQSLDRVGLAAFAHEPAGRFSRGMSQRLALARVFAETPRLVLLDEPSTGLDVRSRAVLEGEIGRAREQGAALIWVSHSIARDLPLADKVLRMDPGRPPAYVGPAVEYQPEEVC